MTHKRKTIIKLALAFVIRMFECSIVRLFAVLFFTNVYYILPAQDFKGGITLGLTTSQVSGDELAGFDKAGLIFGGTVTRKFSDRWSAQMQLVYVQKGSRKPIHPDLGDYDQYKQKLDYIDVPVFLIFKSPFKLNFNWETGLSFGTLIYSREEDEYGPLSGRPSYKIFDLSLQGGVSYMIVEHWVCYMRISNSLLPIRGQVAYVAAAERITGGQYHTVLLFGGEYRF